MVHDKGTYVCTLLTMHRYITYSTDLMQRRTHMQVTVYCLCHTQTPAPEKVTPGIPLEQLTSRNSSLEQCLIKHHYLSMYVSRYVANLLWQRTFFFVQRSCTLP